MNKLVKLMVRTVGIMVLVLCVVCAYALVYANTLDIEMAWTLSGLFALAIIAHALDKDTLLCWLFSGKVT
ncbi:hypothetical protein KKE60_05955 [Patescibacteria group bacterium]|nr:hypothetical protein [Patescibacteria group bacterium]